MTILRIPHASLMCNTWSSRCLVARKLVFRRALGKKVRPGFIKFEHCYCLRYQTTYLTSCAKKQYGHLQTQVRTHRTPTSHMIKILIFFMIKLHICMFDKKKNRIKSTQISQFVPFIH